MPEEKHVTDEMCQERSGHIENTVNRNAQYNKNSLIQLHKKVDGIYDALHNNGISSKVDRHSVWITVLLGAGSIMILVMARIVWIVVE